MKQQKFTKLVKLCTVAATCLLVLLLGIIIGQYVKLSKVNKQNQNLDAQIASLNNERGQLEQGIATRKSPAYIEKTARDQLGMLKDGEIIYIFK